MIKPIGNPSIDELNREVTKRRNVSEEEAQQEVAKRYGFINWRQLETYAEAFGKACSEPHPEKSPELTRMACLNYYCDRDKDFEGAAKLFEEDPSLAKRDIYHACAIGDFETVQDFITEDPEAVHRRGGYFGWEPLLYACYSRLELPGMSTYRVARRLLGSGADPNAHFMWGGQYRFTALCGIFAEGECGPVQYPPHPEPEAFARLLLDAGADPNDGQALYNTMFTPGDLCVKLMLEHGLTPDLRCNWLLHNTTCTALVDNPETTLRYQLKYAIKAGFPSRVRLLVDHGAQLDTPKGERSLYEAAMLSGDAELADYLVEKGAKQTTLKSTSEFLSACLCGNEAKARAMLEKSPKLLEKLRKAHPDYLDLAAETGNYEAMRLYVALGADLNEPKPILQSAVWHGDLKMVQLLVELGADVQRRDNAHDATPMQWANHRGEREAIMVYLCECPIDIFDAILAGSVERVGEMLDETPSLLEITHGELRGDPAKPKESDLLTPLAEAVLWKKPELVRLLVERGAQQNYRNAAGKSLQDLAESQGTPEMAAILTS